MWKMQRCRYNRINAMCQLQCDKCTVTNPMWQVHVSTTFDKCIWEMQLKIVFEKCTLKNKGYKCELRQMQYGKKKFEPQYFWPCIFRSWWDLHMPLFICVCVIQKLAIWLAKMPVSGSGSGVPIRGCLYLYSFSFLSQHSKGKSAQKIGMSIDTAVAVVNMIQ